MAAACPTPTTRSGRSLNCPTVGSADDCDALQGVGGICSSRRIHFHQKSESCHLLAAAAGGPGPGSPLLVSGIHRLVSTDLKLIFTSSRKASNGLYVKSQSFSLRMDRVRRTDSGGLSVTVGPALRSAASGPRPRPRPPGRRHSG